MSDITDTYETLESSFREITTDFLDIQEAEIDAKIEKHTAIYAYFGAVLSYAKKRLDTINVALEHAEAKAMEVHRRELLGSGTKATQGNLNAYIKTLPELQEVRVKLVEAQYKHNLAKNVVDALNHQKDCLVQMSANKRAEVKMVSDLG
jgi:hypothetical protein|tara:strand:+ start:2636 stop:3082 length:447 start_codon:yes stop_codon:yes gene_type:complete